MPSRYLRGVRAALEIGSIWLLFLATHTGLSSVRLRPRLVAVLGPGGYLVAYSLVAAALFVPLVWLYAVNKHAGPFLWSLGPGVRPVMYAGMAAAVSLMAGGLMTPSPVLAPRAGAEVRGVLRFTRHPLFMGVALFGALHLLAMRVNASELATFGGGIAVALLGCWHQDRRKLATDGEDFAAFHAATHFLPRPGPGGLAGLREARGPIALGIALTIAIRWVHPYVFGGG